MVACGVRVDVGCGPGYGVRVSVGMGVGKLCVDVACGGGGGGLVGTAVAVFVARSGVSGGIVTAIVKLVTKAVFTHSATSSEIQPVRPSSSRTLIQSPVLSFASAVTTSPASNDNNVA